MGMVAAEITIKNSDNTINNRGKTPYVNIQIDLQTDRSDLEYVGPVDIKEFQELEEPKNLKTQESKKLILSQAGITAAAHTIKPLTPTPKKGPQIPGQDSNPSTGPKLG